MSLEPLREEMLLARLEALLGPEAVRPGEQPVRGQGPGHEAAGAPGHEAAGDPGRNPEVWVSPGDEEQVKDLLAWATQQKVPVYPRGGGTRWRAAFRPFRGGVGLDTRRLDRLEDLDVENLTVVAGAGTTHAVLQEALAGHCLFFPPETAWPEMSTLGGEVATDASGPRKYAYGSVRTYLLGCRVVFPSGSGGLFGGKQVKNVSGYDVSRFLCGSWGSLGVITRVILKVRPLPEQAVVKVLTGAPSALLRAAEEVRRELYGAAAIEVLLGQAASWWREQVGGGRGGPEGVLLVGLEGAREAVDWQSSWLDGLVRRHPIIPEADLPTSVEDGGRAIWRARQRLFDLAARSGASVWNLAVLPADLGPVIESILDFFPDPGAAGVLGVVAHAGNGHAHLFMAARGPVAGAGPRADEGLLLEKVRGIVRARGGYLLSDDAALAGTSHEVLPEMGALAVVWKRLKQELDPGGILCPAGRCGGEAA
ncbi:MAG: FAD-binding oxidoreductase [Bacillota bacterium]